MISYILFILAAISNSVMDVISFHYDTSVFSKLNPKYWNPLISWENKYVDRDVKKGMRKWFFGKLDIPVAFTDFWHLMKSSMIVLVAAGIAFYQPFLGKYILNLFSMDVNKFICIVFEKLIDFVSLGVLWNCTFSLFFNKIFVLKK